MKLARIAILGKGKVGRALARGWRRAGLEVALGAARRGPTAQHLAADLVVLAVRDGAIAPLAAQLASHPALASRRRRLVVVHTAGALGCAPLAPLRSLGAAVGQMHPLLSFADPARPPPLGGGAMHLSGDAAARRLATTAARRLGMVPVSIEHLDLSLYHAAAALLAGGSVGLAAAAEALLEAAGATAEQTGTMLGPLLASVAHNLCAMGAARALSGPVRRGDAAAVRTHLAALRRAAPNRLALMREVIRAELPLARALGEADGAAFDRVQAALGGEGRCRSEKA